MNKSIQSRLLVIFFSLSTGVFAQHSGKTSSLVKQDITIAFRENKGQVADQHKQSRPDVLYYGTDGSMSFYLKTDGVSYQMSHVNSWKESQLAKNSGSAKTQRDNAGRVPSDVTISRLDISWAGCNKSVRKQADEQLSGTDNYYTSACPEGITGVRSFKGVTYRELYNGVDLKYYTAENHLKYDYIVAPYAEYQQIRMIISGAEKLGINERGELVIETQSGAITEPQPEVFQGSRKLKAAWVLNGNTVSFQIEGRDKSLPMTIDPLVRAWGTYYGGEMPDRFTDVKTDDAGNVICYGYTFGSATGIATTGAFQTTLSGSGMFVPDAILVKFDADGTRLWGTYYGGDNEEISYNCVQHNDEIVICGLTASVNIIASSTAFQPAFAGGGADLFIAKFSSAGTRIWGTYYGGSNFEEYAGITIDDLGQTYLAGTTQSTNNISTSGSFQGARDAFIAKFDAAGVRIISRYFGGSQVDYGYGCRLDHSGSVWIYGETGSSSGIASTGAFQPSYSGNSDGYIAKLGSNLETIYASYFGGPASDFMEDVVFDAGNNAIFAGTTESASNIATTGSHQQTFGNTPCYLDGDLFFGKLLSGGSLAFASYYGGLDAEHDARLAKDGTGNFYLSGTTASPNAISTPGAYQENISGPVVFTTSCTPVDADHYNDDAFLLKFDGNGNRLFGFYYGGNESEVCRGVDVNAAGAIYLAGGSYSSSGITTPGSHQPEISPSFSEDAFLVKFDESCMPLPVITGADRMCPGSTVELTSSYPGNILWSTGETTQTINISSPGNYFVTATDGGCSATSAPFNISVENPSIATNGIVNASCGLGNGSIIINGISGGGSLAWNGPVSDTENNTSFPFTITGLPEGTYTIAYLSPNDCFSDTLAVAITGTSPATAPVITGNNEMCEGETVQLSSSATSGNIWSNNFSSQTITVSAPGVYFTTVTDANGCTATSNVITVIVHEPPTAAITGNTTVVTGQTVQLQASGGISYSWSPTSGLSCADCPNPVFNASALASYVYEVEVTGTNGCSSMASITITVEPNCGEVFIPDIFSPNDDHKNELLCTYGNCFKEVVFAIYNRWGEKVFETDDAAVCWDGTFKGKSAEGDVFAYKLTGTLHTGETTERSGNIQLVR